MIIRNGKVGFNLFQAESDRKLYDFLIHYPHFSGIMVVMTYFQRIGMS